VGITKTIAPMPKGPKRPVAPVDVIGNAVKVMRIATGEEPDAVLVTAPLRRSRSIGTER
jgi:hypothetical protein